MRLPPKTLVPKDRHPSPRGPPERSRSTPVGLPFTERPSLIKEILPFHIHNLARNARFSFFFSKIYPSIRKQFRSSPTSCRDASDPLSPILTPSILQERKIQESQKTPVFSVPTLFLRRKNTPFSDSKSTHPISFTD